MEFEVRTVTPTEAKRYLEKNIMNRKVRMSSVEAYARDMMSGDWQINSQAIAFAEDGVLLDGQHRLMACVMANVPFETLIVRGISKEAMPTIDTGAMRTYSDNLKMRGIGNSRNIAAAVRKWYFIKKYGVSSAFGGLSQKKKKVTNSELDRFMQEHSDDLNLLQSIPSKKAFRLLGVPESTITPLYLEFKDAAGLYAAQRFFDQLLDKHRGSHGNPADTCRTTLWSWASRRRSGEPISARRQAACIIKAWNKWSAGECAHQIKLANNQGQEKFPEIRKSATLSTRWLED